MRKRFCILREEIKKNGVRFERKNGGEISGGRGSINFSALRREFAPFDDQKEKNLIDLFPANYVPVTPTEEFRACLSYPCHPTSTCLDLPSATFACICHSNYTGLLCDEEINKRDYEVPSFDGKSYVRMNRLKAYHKFSVEVEFKTYADNGIILYNQQKSDGTGDFVSLAIVDGSVLVIA